MLGQQMSRNNRKPKTRQKRTKRERPIGLGILMMVSDDIEKTVDPSDQGVPDEEKDNRRRKKETGGARGF